MTLRLALAVCAAVIFAVPPAAASVPSAMNYQGKLTDSSGKPLPDDSYPITFRLYKDEKDEKPLWSSAPLYVNTFGGVFNTLIGNIPDDIFESDQLYLETVIKDLPLSPRQKILSVGYAFRAQKAYDVADGIVTGPKIAQGAVTASHLSLPLSVSSSEPAGAPVKSANSSTLKGIGLWGSTGADGSDWVAAGVAGNQGTGLKSPALWNPDYKRAGVYGYSDFAGASASASGHGVVGWSENGYGGLFHSTSSAALAVDGPAMLAGDLNLSGTRSVNAPAGLTINGPGNLDVVIGTSDITIRGDAANTYVKILSDGSIQIKSAANMNLNAGGTLSLSGTVVNVNASGNLDMKAGLIKLN